MDCRTARLLLHFARPLSTELEASEAEALQTHLVDCPECAPLARTAHQFDDRLGQAMRDVPIPDGLRDRLLARLGAERDARHWRLLKWGSAIAAAVLVAVLLGWNLRSRQLPAINLDDLCTVAVGQRGAAREDVETAFLEKGVRITLPSQFDYGRYLAFYGLVDFQGKSVPQLVFTRKDDVARVLVLNDRQFDMEVLKQLVDQPADSLGLTVKVLLDPANPRFAYVIIFTGGPQMWFLHEPQPAT